jgi:uncharacterized membrane protein
MFTGFCHSGTWGSLGNFDVWGGIGLILNLVIGLGLLAGLTLLVVLAIRRARVPSAAVQNAGGQPTAGSLQTAKEILQAQYARGEITREQYELRKQEIG